MSQDPLPANAYTILMGRFATTVDFYSLYREPYVPQFFRTVADKLEFKNSDDLLDVGCGPALLALGFAPCVGHCTGIDPEPAMLQAANKAAMEAGRPLALQLTRLEDFNTSSRFPIITIGRAHHWLDRVPALAKLDELLAPGGRILICGASSVANPHSPWIDAYNALRRSWSSEDEKLYEKDGVVWFAGSSFSHSDEISVTELRSVTIAELIGRTLSKSNTSPAALGARRAQLESEMFALLETFAGHGILREQILARASVFTRP